MEVGARKAEGEGIERFEAVFGEFSKFVTKMEGRKPEK